MRLDAREKQAFKESPSLKGWRYRCGYVYISGKWLGRNFRSQAARWLFRKNKDEVRTLGTRLVPGKDIKQVDAVVRIFDMTAEEEWGFRDYIHDQKDAGYHGSKKNGDFTFKELIQLAREYLGLTDE